MSNITTTGTTGYPGVIDTRTALTDGATGDQIVANHPNGLGAAVLAVEAALGTTPQGSAADVVTRLNISQNTDGTIKSSVVAAGTGAAVGYSSGVFTVSFSGDGPSFSQNYGLLVRANTPVANQMTIWLQQADLSTPTVALPCRFAVRNASTLSSGTYTIVVATQQTALVVSGGSTLGMAVGEIARLYFGIVVSNNVPELCIWNPKTWYNMGGATGAERHMLMQLFRPSETEYISTTAEGGTGTADSAATLYSTTARSAVPMRIIGYMDIQTGAVAGNWSNQPFTINLVGPQTKISGDVVQTFSTVTSTYTQSGSNTPIDGTNPLITEGLIALVATMTATNQVNPIRISAIHNSTSSSGSNITTHLHVNASTNAQLAYSVDTANANDMTTCILEGTLATNSGAATGYYLLVGSQANLLYFNGVTNSGVSAFAGASVARLTIEEIAN